LKSLIRSLSFDRKRGFLKAADTISLDIIPGDQSMKQFEKMPSNSSQNMSLIGSLRQSGLFADYDYIFIDSAPQWEPIGRIAAHTADIIFPIVDSSTLATRAVIRMKDFLLMEKSFDDPLYDHAMMPTLGKIILNCRSADKKIAEAERKKIKERLQSENLPCEVAVMRNNAYIANAVSKGIPVVISRPNSPETENIKQITKFLLIDN
jgi:cellulose biosynthesis protein BcsQ